MNLLTVSSTEFPLTQKEIASRTEGYSQDLGKIAIFGGAARSALLEATLDIVRPVRDLDVIGIDSSLSSESFKDAHHIFNPEDKDRESTKVVKFNGEVAALKTVDFTINESLMLLGEKKSLVVSRDAVNHSRARVIKPAAAMIQLTRDLMKGGDSTHRQFLRNRTGMPARAAYFAATLRAAGNDFSIDLLNHPRPKDPSETHRFFLGATVKKSLMMDEIERGPGDITATKILFELFRELKLADDCLPQTPEDVIAFCEQINDQYPQLHFFGSEIAARVQHSTKTPPPKNP